MSRYISFRDFDWLLFIFVLLICGLGVTEIRSATAHTKFAGAHIRQLYWISGGVAGMFLMSFVNYQKLLDGVHWMYIASIASLMTVMIFGQKYLGARRWIKMPGGGHFQPSEWVKLILMLTCINGSSPGLISLRQAQLSEFPCSWCWLNPIWARR